MKKDKTYGFSNQVHHRAMNIIRTDVFVNQSSLIEQALILDEPICEITIDNIQNLYDEEDQLKEVLEWWLVSDWLGRHLINEGEVVIQSDVGHYWGRTCSGQSIILDGTIQDIIITLQGGIAS